MGVRAYWHDGKKANRTGVVVGTKVNLKTLKETYGSEADAMAAPVVAETASMGAVKAVAPADPVAVTASPQRVAVDERRKGGRAGGHEAQGNVAHVRCSKLGF